LQATALVGSAMTYSLFEYAKDSVDALMPDSLLCSSNVQVFTVFAYFLPGEYISVKFICLPGTLFVHFGMHVNLECLVMLMI